SPMPPRPIDAVISYGPRRVAGARTTEGAPCSTMGRRRDVPQLQVVDEPMQVRRVDAEQARGRRVVAAGAVDRVETEAALPVEHRAVVGGAVGRQRGGRLQDGRRQ